MTESITTPPEQPPQHPNTPPATDTPPVMLNPKSSSSGKTLNPNAESAINQDVGGQTPEELGSDDVQEIPPPSNRSLPRGIIRNFKGYYLRRFNRLLLKRIDDHVLEPSKVSLLDGIVNVVASWSIDVKTHTIKNCFKHWKILSDGADELEVTKELDEKDQRIVAGLRNQIEELHYNNQMDMDVFLDHPNEQQVVYALTEGGIIAGIRQEAQSDNPKDDSVEIEKVCVKKLQACWTSWKCFGFNKKLAAGEIFLAMEASNFYALDFKPQMNQPRFFGHIMLDTRERSCLPHACIDSGRMLRQHLFTHPNKRYNLVLGGNSGVGANFLPACNDQLHVGLFVFYALCYSDPSVYIPRRGTDHKQFPRSRPSISRQVMREEFGGTLSGESILLNEQTLERELQIAIDQENYAQAAKIRDSLRLLQEDTKSSVLAANAKFYKFFRNGDLAAMQGLWSKGEHVCVVHPGVSGISGYDLVMGSWEFVWADYEFPLEIEVKDARVHVKGDMGYVTCIEMVKTKGSSWGRHFATNVFERVDGQWFMCIHHASYVDL
ncbi:hypothetical protein BUALT_Bualt11G0124900 [Buddleja alternifolia]|uniref:Uncharacterized protein n=1 Tax=Buddleja alternifolia TaxID=168488 RepID=A0AAV6X1S1_9LAMI|nr:hypothetical protein BUALT_Bualt11G0124900 [Buddleja alternifolia]